MPTATRAAPPTARTAGLRSPETASTSPSSIPTALSALYDRPRHRSTTTRRSWCCSSSESRGSCCQKCSRTATWRWTRSWQAPGLFRGCRKCRAATSAKYVTREGPPDSDPAPARPGANTNRHFHRRDTNSRPSSPTRPRPPHTCALAPRPGGRRPPPRP